MIVFMRWLYAVITTVFLLFVLPSMMSTPDTMIVIAGVLSFVLWCVWSYYFVKKLIHQMEHRADEKSQVGGTTGTNRPTDSGVHEHRPARKRRSAGKSVRNG